MMKKSIPIVFPLLVLFFTTQLNAQPLTITGTIPGAELQELRLMVYDDYISYRQKVVLRTRIDAAGKFEFKTDIHETQQFFLEVGHYSGSFFAEKNGTYVLLCDTVSLLGENRPLYNKVVLPATIESEPPPGLNALISGFNRAYNEFIMKEFSGIYQRRNTGILTDFRKQVEQEYRQYDQPFLDQYITYKLAVVELAMAPSKKPALFRDYLMNKPILLRHPEYMDFFNDFFDNHLFPDNRFIPRTDLYASINYQPDRSALLDSVGKDTTLRNEVLRELVCLKSLKSLYRSKDFSHPNILVLLEDFERNSKFQYHRLVAENLQYDLTHLQNGFPPPGFELPDLEDNLVKLTGFRGRPVYISFITTWSSGCLAELELMKRLFEEYGSRISFVSIALDNEIGIVRDLVSEKGYNWDFLFNGQDFDLIFDYKLKTYPTFLLLDSSGLVFEYPAYKPSEVIRDSFDRVLNKP
jgi:thiol-disulfide isomerase/thioredoxin